MSEIVSGAVAAAVHEVAKRKKNKLAEMPKDQQEEEEILDQARINIDHMHSNSGQRTDGITNTKQMIEIAKKVPSGALPPSL